MGALTRILTPLVGQPIALPDELLARFPELRGAHFRRGGLPVRIGGWFIGQSTAAGLTLWRTVFLGHDVPPSVELLLHEVRHVHQFEASAAFPVRYLWESLRRGYHHNRFEADARAYAAERLRDVGSELRRGEG